MMFEAQPTDFKRLAVIFVMRLGFWISTDLTGLAVKTTVTNGVTYCVSGFVFFWMLFALCFLVNDASELPNRL